MRLLAVAGAVVLLAVVACLVVAAAVPGSGVWMLYGLQVLAVCAALVGAVLWAHERGRP